ncbi:alcohol dehydrogenase catalytic domain-containing protein [Streptomyces sp. NPDC047009]|uniref:alcohol dehydrogenase catalytic domain-containing protein n=1 Tax=Streptomyces sp. NPDC047009 TaxID=3154496 RepID=UPI0033D66CB6
MDVEIPDAEPGPGEVAVRTHISGLCTSELPAWSGHDGTRPLRPGHELSGEITAVGAGVHG